MVAASFDYVRVDSWAAAAQALAEHGEDAKIIAGGQSLAPMLNLRLAQPTVLVDVNDIATEPPAVRDSTLWLPALTRHRTLATSPVVREHCPLLGAAAAYIGNVRVRSRGTVGGSLAHADPTSEIGCCALALDATVVACGPAGERTIPARDFFVTYLTTVLEPVEVVTDVRFPASTADQGWSFQEIVRRASDFAVVAVAARIEVDRSADAISSADLALAGVDHRVVLADSAHLEPVVGSRADAAAVREAAAAVAGSVDPESDVHASGSYRKRLVEVLTRRALQEAYQRAAVRGEAA